jgi:hypothetical protein
MTAPDSDAIAELDGAIAAHWLWLRAEGIPTPVHDDDDGSGQRLRTDDPPKALLARLGPIEAMVVLEQAKIFSKSERSALIGAVLNSLCRLSAFRNAVVGLERVREDFERRRAEAKGPEQKDKALVELSLDASHLAVVEKSFAELVRRSGWVYGSLRKFRVALAKRAREYAKGGFEPGLHGVARAMFLSKWIEGRVVDLLVDIEWFREETRGGPGAELVVYSSTPDAKALRREQAECKRLVKDARASHALVLQLFPASHPDEPKRRPKDRVRKQIRRRKSA